MLISSEYIVEGRFCYHFCRWAGRELFALDCVNLSTRCHLRAFICEQSRVVNVVEACAMHDESFLEEDEDD